MRVRVVLLAGMLSCGAPSPDPDAPDAGETLLAPDRARALAQVLPEALPPAPGNAHGDSVAAAALGFQIFFDARFSAAADVRCASCHQPERAFHDGLPVPSAIGRVDRNSPTMLNAAWKSAQFWDGRADSLWSQPLFAFENPDEMAFTRLQIVHRVARSYRASYEAAFGPLGDVSTLPPAGKPGDPAFDDLPGADRERVNRVAANVGKALEAYARKLAAGRSRFDRWALGDAAALADDETRGLLVFQRERCDACHGGPLFSDGAYHDAGIAAAPGAPFDPGRAGAYAVLEGSVFNAAGPFWDGERPAGAGIVPRSDGDLAAFATPSLRNVGRTAPYFHNGTGATLEDALLVHAGAGLGDGDRADLVAFLRALDGAYPPPPWNNWPDK